MIELVDVEAPNLWGHFKDGVLEACDDVCGDKGGGGRSKGDTWWWNEDVKEVISRMKDAHKARCQNSSEVIKRRSMKNITKKPVLKAMREKAEEVLTEYTNCLNGMFRLVKGGRKLFES